ncbi:MAG: single-stranded-DNA-specific exonuclease RecJ [Planctomycetota bacterium]
MSSDDSAPMPHVPPHDPRERALARTVGVPDLLCRVLLARGVDDPDRARRHLRPDLRELHDPFRFTQMERAVARVRQAIDQRQRIVVHGDYDVDGIAGTVVLVKFLRLVGADVDAFIPDRRDGYSFTEASLQAVRDGGYGLCVSVDNGTNANKYITKIQEIGCDVLVTDHHGTSDNVAPAHTLLNPRLPDAGYPDRELAGVGVAYTLTRALAESFSRGKKPSDELAQFLVDAMGLVALGTVADVAPLRGENRILVFHGLRALAQSANPGIRALLDSANVTNRSPGAEDIAFRIAPLINAAGRMGRATRAVDLLMSTGYQDAQEAARVLEKHNEERRKVERALVDEVLVEAEASADAILVHGREGWHPGVLGIVASRIAETLGKPAILVAFDGERGRGSGRSAGMLNLRDALAACSNCLVAHGGHAAAVGLEIEQARFDEFRASINRVAGSLVQSAGFGKPDGFAELTELDAKVVRKLDLLATFGAGNPRPLFMSPAVRIIGRPTTDSRSNDLRFRVSGNGAIFTARLRRGASRFEEIRNLDSPVQLLYSPRLASWGEDGPVELHVEHLKLDGERPSASAAER